MFLEPYFMKEAN